ncbi:MAG: polysaccharide deacetylase family protein [Lachnospiraceae bacterium]|jgi:peptidoglycan/xylan/chitin deacetylase (PgdA/CDA1 family)|nr:polysaccharide deacetylase family protein [Lachnospiraceae bacterium]
MAQEERNEKRPENFRLSHRSRNRITSANSQNHVERRTVSEVPGAGRRVDSEGRQAGGRQTAAGQQTMHRQQMAPAGQRPAGGRQTAAGQQTIQRRQTAATGQRPAGRQQAASQRPAGDPQAAGAGRQTAGKTQSRRASSEARWARWEEEKYRRQKAEQEQQQRRTRIIIITLAAAVAVLAVALVLWLVFGREKAPSEPVAATQESQTKGVSQTDKKLSDADFSFTVPVEKQEVGTPGEAKELADYEGYAVRYPTIGNETIDGAISKRVDDMVSVFKRQVQEMRTDGRTRMTMAADYESYQTGEALISVKFNIHKELPQADQAGDSIETYTYQMSDGAELSLSNVLTEGYLELLSGKTKEFAQAQGGTLRAGAAEAVDTNFKCYTWNEDGLTLYFPGGTLIDGVSEVLSFTIPMEELSGYLTMDLTGNGQAAQAPVSGNVDPSKPMVCLTFDDGPKASTTGELLDILEENDARATFFVVGDALKGSSAEELIRRELALGCQVGNHTANHKNFRKITDEEIESQIEGVNDILKGWGLPATSTVRPPYGGWDNHVRDVVKYPMARWNVDTLDWETKDPEATIQCVLYDEVKKAADGDIILMHDIHPETIEACRTIIPELKARGFQLVTMEEMFAAKGISYEAGKVYYSSGDIRTDFGE